MTEKVEIISYKKRVCIPLGENGSPIGQYHGRAKLSDAQVEQIRTWNESGAGYKKIVKMVKEQFGETIHRNTIRHICVYLSHATTPEAYKTKIIELKPGQSIRIKGIGTFTCPPKE